MENSEVLSTAPSQPVLREPTDGPDFLARSLTRERKDRPEAFYIGRLRIPIAGPYRPWARLYRLPDRRLVWVVRLWDRDRAARHVTTTATLLAFARLNHLPGLAARIRWLDRRGRSWA